MLVLKILGSVILFALYITAVVLFHKYRAWLTYYVLAAFGLVLALVMTLRMSGLDKHIEFSELSMVRLIAAPLGIAVGVLAANTIQVTDAVGPIALTMGIESSALIESAILIGLVIFYPAFVWQQKLRYLAIGLIAILVTNIIRVTIIVSMTSYFGRETIFISHTIVGRLFFFVCMIILFWYVLTRPTIDAVSKIIRGEE